MTVAKGAASGPPAAVAQIDKVLERALDLLEEHPAQALSEAQSVLQAADHPVALLIAGIATRRLNDTATALSTLLRLLKIWPQAGVAHYEYGLALSAAGQQKAAIDSLRRAAELSPDLPGVWRALAHQLSVSGNVQAADAAFARHRALAQNDPYLMRAGAALVANEIPQAEFLLREHLKRHPTDVVALRMLAEVAARMGRYADAEVVLVECLRLAPGFTEARANYVTVLNRQNRKLEALSQLDQVLASDPGNPNHRNLKATSLVAIGEYQAAIKVYVSLLAEYPRQPHTWLCYGHVLKTAGRVEEALQAYRKCVELAPNFGDVWFTLSNLKTYRFSDRDITAMQAALKFDKSSVDDQVHLQFALGKAFEDARDFEKSFAHYAQGNRLRGTQIQYSADETSRIVAGSRQVFSRDRLAEYASAGHPARDPIFIVGLPRAGSTLVDQILSSHSLVEGTMELYEMIDLARSIEAAEPDETAAQYPDTVLSLDGARLREIGEQYLQRTRIQRKTDAPYFIDKMPNNWTYAGLIALALSNAKIIDVRRHPLGCCFSVFKQCFARGQHFSYDLTDTGRYYRDYVCLMDHFDTVMPGRVHRVHYETLVEDTETEVRKLLEYCELPFEESCLKFYENDRPVRTASSEQVRQPIFRDGLEQWRNYERWLDPLKLALGSVLTSYPSAPQS